MKENLCLDVHDLFQRFTGKVVHNMVLKKVKDPHSDAKCIKLQWVENPQVWWSIYVRDVVSVLLCESPFLSLFFIVWQSSVGHIFCCPVFCQPVWEGEPAPSSSSSLIPATYGSCQGGPKVQITAQESTSAARHVGLYVNHLHVSPELTIHVKSN